jgi:protein tyrosine/serine phosphatase
MEEKGKMFPKGDRGEEKKSHYHSHTIRRKRRSFKEEKTMMAVFFCHESREINHEKIHSTFISLFFFFVE